jgi:hypothetical protein
MADVYEKQQQTDAEKCLVCIFINFNLRQMFLR